MSHFRLDRPVQFLKGVGPRRSDSLKKLAIGTARDLLYHVPRRYDDASTIVPIATLQVGSDATAVGRVRTKGVIPTRSGLRIFQAVLEDGSGYITCSWPGQPWLDRRIQEGDELLVTGPVKHYHGRQLHPREFTILARAPKDAPMAGAEGTGEESGGGDRGSGRHDKRSGGGEERSEGGAAGKGAIFVTYPSVDEVPQWVLRGILARNLDALVEEIPEEEYLTAGERARLGVADLASTFRSLHGPSSVREPEEGRRRLAFDELFFLQLVQALARHRDTEAEPGIAFERTNTLIRPLHEALPFRLTGGQTVVLKEIFEDMTSGRRMNRFLQGDVGSGKTLVALFAMLLAAESGYQSALMAPTELLAEQHYATLRRLLSEGGLDLEVVLVTGRAPAAERKRALAALADGGSAVLAVGTHALIQETVRFRRLGLVVVDEQHRFGVRQRMALVDGGGGPSPRPDVLVMSATPIPRSLAMALYGDLDLSVLAEMPSGRIPVETWLRRPGDLDQVYARAAIELEKGHQGFVVYPQVEESEKTDLKAATVEYERLAREVFPDRRVGLLHGQLAAEERERVMRAFRDGEVDLVVATSIVEVGIDVPNATFMVIEHAERFGLSQLHQLRGRVGRGGAPSLCILVSDVGGEAEERLRVFRDTTDGFQIAQADLRIRGQGDLFGARQHGKDLFLRFADLSRDEELLLAAREMARGMVARDPGLDSPEHAKIRALLESRHHERLKMWRVG